MVVHVFGELRVTRELDPEEVKAETCEEGHDCELIIPGCAGELCYLLDVEYSKNSLG
jgi:hypothetical protein